MKKIVILTLLLMISLSGCVDTKNHKQDCVRIHIRANSNSEIDQSVKLDVRSSAASDVYKRQTLRRCFQIASRRTTQKK